MILFIVIAVTALTMRACSTKENIRDYSYESYCDSIYEADPNYYLDVLCETDEYCSYIEEHGQWW